MELAIFVVICAAGIVTGFRPGKPIYNIKNGGGAGNYGPMAGGWGGNNNIYVRPKPLIKKPQPPPAFIPNGYGGPQYCWCAPKCVDVQFIGPCPNCLGCNMQFCCSSKPPQKVMGPTATCACQGRCQVKQTFLGPCPFCGNNGCDSSFCCNLNQMPPVGPGCRCQGVCGYGQTIMGPCPWCKKDCTNKLLCCGAGKKG
ncbi:uncharacterized protein LOC128227218 [Mya arenaria]|uniref:uncharacterized protein LOC128227218 n=1 Tax=Mya arenaria TaxID=6604 RepID=UPI0022E9793A|nr:uncharacterized protein LOC128227218 [Mya arenaria]